MILRAFHVTILALSIGLPGTFASSVHAMPQAAPADGSASHDSGPAEADDFQRLVAPLLATKCLECHNGPSGEGDLDLSRREGALRGGESGAAVVPGELNKSLLWDYVSQDEMPPDAPLTEDEKRVLRDWIEQGATWGSQPIDPFDYSTDHRAGYDWWSLQPLHQDAFPPFETLVPNQPSILDSVDLANWSRNPIDAFVLQTLIEKGLSPSPEADPRTLVRRLYIDLTGLPPDYEVIERFAAEPTLEAWECLVDDLLDSPRYGERWARHWLDIARFGESQGYEYNEPRHNAWPYRDWLIQALNSDLPYDEFARLQLAGDVYAADAWTGAAATGFLVAGPHNTILGVNPTMKLAGRHDELEELAGTVAQTFLGMTMHCARCHDHKFDPISQTEYYRFIASLAGVGHGEQSLPSGPLEAKETQELVAARAEVENRLIEQILSRDGSVSQTANVLVSKTPLNANEQGTRYRVTFQLAPTTWAAAAQATGDLDGVTVALLKPDGSTLFSHSAQPGSWQRQDKPPKFATFAFEYEGDGRGPVVIQLRPYPLNSGRFGGAIDDLRLIEIPTGRELWRESFDDLISKHDPGVQADTGSEVWFGAESSAWRHTGTNTIHVVKRSNDNLAVQLFSGDGGSGALPAVGDDEAALRNELESIDARIASNGSRKVYSTVAAPLSAMHVFARGDVRLPGEVITPGGIKGLKDLQADFGLDSNATDKERRQRLAEWITHKDNPLFHRVAVNRVWHYHFGKGLVTTPSDFGFNGGRPSHPELLDWLSIWFRNNDYSLKKLHRLIVTSATYRQSSADREAASRVDQDNRWLWRQNPRRVEAEVLRDSVLAIAGELNDRPFGPGFRDVELVMVGAACYYLPRDFSDLAADTTTTDWQRRSIYRWQVRGQRSALYDTFDCPDPSTRTPTRMVTTTPSQALSQWNAPFMTHFSSRLARRVQSEVGGELPNQIEHAWRLALGRKPTEVELDQATHLVEEHGLELLCRVLFNSNEFILID